MDAPRKSRESRVNRRIPVQFGTFEASRTGFTKDLSMHGLEISSNMAFEPDTHIKIQIENQRGPVFVTGEVIWNDDEHRRVTLRGFNSKMGVRIITSSPNYGVFLAHIVEGQTDSPSDRIQKTRVYKPFVNLQEFMDDFTKNISQGGLFVETDQILPINTYLEVRLFFGDILKIIPIKGRVAHIITEESARNMGIEPGIAVQLSGKINLDTDILSLYAQNINDNLGNN